MSYISAIGIASPPHKITQETTATFVSKSLGLNDEESRRLSALYRSTGIHSRYTVIPDYNSQPSEYVFYPKNEQLEPFPNTSKRMGVYKQNSLGLTIAAVENCLLHCPGVAMSEITHLITVSCTGLFAPGLDILLVEELGLNTTVNRTGINFMGCYAAFNAIKVADDICSSHKSAKVLIVSVEICSIHFQKSTQEDHLLSGALFGDGAAALLIESEQSSEIGLQTAKFHNDLELTGKGEMAWQIGDFGFEMRLSSYVPNLIQKGISKLTKRLLDKLGLKVSDIGFFAIHPGGKRILEVIEKELGISKTENKPAYAVMQEYGNMSSPTVLFVLKYILDRLKSEDHGSNVLSFAFGPGLTLESMLLKVNYSNA